MENFEYYRVFPSESEEADDLSLSEAETFENLIIIYENEILKKPRLLLPFAPVLFEKTVLACEQIAKEFSGKIRAKIDYTFFSATIELWCCYVEFVRGEFMSILHEISRHALSVRFTPLTSGELHIEILMPYFVSAQGIN